jgi:hypothetical protein
MTTARTGRSGRLGGKGRSDEPSSARGELRSDGRARERLVVSEADFRPSSSCVGGQNEEGGQTGLTFMAGGGWQGARSGRGRLASVRLKEGGGGLTESQLARPARDAKRGERKASERAWTVTGWLGLAGCRTARRDGKRGERPVRAAGSKREAEGKER